MPTARAGDGTELYYETWGPPDGDPLLLVMGLGADRRAWLAQRYAFGRHYRCITFDNRGAGSSDKPPGPYSLEDMASDATVVLDAVGVERAHVVGASMGGVISQILAVRHPERVRSLVLACTACRHHEWRRELLGSWADTALEGGMAALGADAFRWLIGPRIQRRFGLWLNLLARVVTSQPSHGFAAQARAILNMSDELRFELAALAVPALVIVGSQDILTPVGDAEELVEMLPDARLEVIHGAAHGLMVEAPAAFNSAVLRFLAEVGDAVPVDGTSDDGALDRTFDDAALPSVGEASA